MQVPLRQEFRKSTQNLFIGLYNKLRAKTSKFARGLFSRPFSAIFITLASGCGWSCLRIFFVP
jgi:hypothetical protein